MALFLARHVCPKTVPKIPLRLHLSSTANGSGEDDDNQRVQNQLNRLHTYETIDDPNSLVKTTIIRRNPVLQRAKTPEEILEDVANSVAKKKPEQEIKDKTTLLKSGLSDGTNDVNNDPNEKVYWGHDGKKSIVGYDIFHELEERLEEILSRTEQANSLENEDKEKNDTEKSNGKLAKISIVLEGINRLLRFYLLRSYLYQKHW